MFPDVPRVTARDLADRLARGERLLIVDVREPWELALARLDGTLDIPMREVAARLHELPRDAPVVVMCHHGIRSAHVTALLRERGVDAVNLAGGIDAWARDVAGAVRTY